MEQYIIPFSGICFGVLLIIVFWKRRKVKYSIGVPDSSFIGCLYIPRLWRKRK